MSESARTTAPQAEAVAAALDLILAHFPDLAGAASKAKRRPSDHFRAKAVARLAAQAADLPPYRRLSAAQRAVLASVLEAPQDDTRDAHLPAVRCKTAQLERLRKEAEKEGLSLSDLVRRKLFPEDD